MKDRAHFARMKDRAHFARMKDRAHFARMVDPTYGAGPWKHAPAKRAKPRSIGPVFVCLIGVIVAVFGLTLISG